MAQADSAVAAAAGASIEADTVADAAACAVALAAVLVGGDADAGEQTQVLLDCHTSVSDWAECLHHVDEQVDGVLWQDAEGVQQHIDLALCNATKQGGQLLQLAQGHLQGVEGWGGSEETGGGEGGWWDRGQGASRILSPEV